MASSGVSGNARFAIEVEVAGRVGPTQAHVTVFGTSETGNMAAYETVLGFGALEENESYQLDVTVRRGARRSGGGGVRHWLPPARYDLCFRTFGLQRGDAR